MKKIILVIVSIFVTMTFLKADCIDPKNDFDGAYCSTKVYLRADSTLNDIYDELIQLLKDEEKEILKNSQIKWMEQRNARCSMNTSQGFFINFECATATTRTRTKFLMKRLDECQSPEGCDKDKLAKILD